MATKAVNDTTRTEGLFITLLLFGALPLPVRQQPAPKQLARAKSMDDAMKEVAKIKAQRSIWFRLRHYRGPNGMEASMDPKKLPSGYSVRIYRERTNKWEGPFTFMECNGDTCIEKLPHGRRIFRSTVVKPLDRPKWDWKGISLTTILL